MKLAAKGGVKWWERQSFRWFRLQKRTRQFVKFPPDRDKTVLFIVGCQRSGTSMIHHLFRLDWDTVTYDEVSPLSASDAVEGLRFNPWLEVAARIRADRAPLVVCKPLVESQNLAGLLDLFRQTRAIWMYRDFLDVVKSNLEFFGPQTGHADLAPILAGDETNWRAERLAPEAREVIRGLYSPDISPHDAAALFWYARNSLYFSGGCDRDSRVRTCCYGDLVTHPQEVMFAAYEFLDYRYPGDRILTDVVASSRGRGNDVVLSAPVRELCEKMLLQLKQQRGLPDHAVD